MSEDSHECDVDHGNVMFVHKARVGVGIFGGVGQAVDMVDHVESYTVNERGDLTVYDTAGRLHWYRYAATDSVTYCPMGTVVAHPPEAQNRA